MFYTMKLFVLLVAVSLMFAGAAITSTVPKIAEAAPGHSWCYSVGPDDICAKNGDTFNGKGECKSAQKEFQEANPGIAIQPCHKLLLIS